MCGDHLPLTTKTSTYMIGLSPTLSLITSHKAIDVGKKLRNWLQHKISFKRINLDIFNINVILRKLMKCWKRLGMQKAHHLKVNHLTPANSVWTQMALSTCHQWINRDSNLVHFRINFESLWSLGIFKLDCFTFYFRRKLMSGAFLIDSIYFRKMSCF